VPSHSRTSISCSAHPGLELGVISDKLVRRRRGGYCYEHALLFAAVLERLGFAVQRRIARVQPHRPDSRTQWHDGLVR